MKEDVDELTRESFLIALISLRISSNFLSVMLLVVDCVLAREQRQTAKRAKRTSFILSVAGNRSPNVAL